MNKYSADELFKIAYSHLQKKEFKKSTQLFEKLLNDFPDNLSILRNLSHSYAFSGAFKQAEECIKKIIKIKPDEPFAYQFLASVLKNQDKIEETIKVVNEGLKKNLINKIPSGNLGTGEDVSNCVAFLASDMANYINGETVHVNGGMYMA